MNTEETEGLLYQLGDLPDENGERLPEATLESYQTGKLSAEEAQEVELRLASSPASRARLAELGGVRPAEPPARVRELVLARLREDQASRLLRPEAPARSRFWRGPKGWAAAATLAFALIGSCLLLPRLQREHLASLPDYEVSASGLAAERSTTAGGAHIVVFPDTRVVLEVAAREEGVRGTELALLHRRSGQLVRVPLRGEVEVEAGPGAWRVVAPAGALVGDAVGPQHLWAVVAWSGSLPSAAEVSAASSGEDLAKEGRRLLAIEMDVQPAPEIRNRDGGKP